MSKIRAALATTAIAAFAGVVIAAAPAQAVQPKTITMPALATGSNNGTGNWYWSKSCSVWGTGGKTNLVVTNYDYGSGRQQYHVDADKGFAAWVNIAFDGTYFTGRTDDFFLTVYDRSKHRWTLSSSLGSCSIYG